MESFLDRLQEELTVDEGCKYEIYLDHLGLPTFGIGHLIKEQDPEHGRPVGTKVDEIRVSECFNQDIMVTLQDCKNVFEDFDALPQEVRLIVANMIFNLGRPRFLGFKECIQAIKDGDWFEASVQMQDSKWYKQVTNRAQRLVDRMRAIDS